MDTYIGKLLDNRYEILELIGAGGMARVYKARCHRLNRLVAIKILREDLAQDAEFRRRFHDESQAVAMLSHPNIVAVYDVSRSSEVEYIVMELIDGITLKQYMQKKGDKLNWREALHFTTQIVKALGHAHGRGIIHRDIKPHNIMVLRDGSVKVADFGIARVSSGRHSTLTQEALGSVHYISPEQARGSHIDARSDLYSVGVVLYEMITGRLPFEGDTPVSVAIQHINSIPLSPREIDPSLPEALEEITMKAMAPKVDDRYGSADEMLADLEEFRKNPSINFDYNIQDFAPEDPLDEDRTRIHTAVSTTTGLQSTTTSLDLGGEEDEEEYKRTSPKVVIACVAAILLFVGLVIFALVKVFVSDLFAPQESFVVPNLLGELYEDVVNDNELLKDHFQIILVDSVDDEAEPGTIIKQEPEGETTVGASEVEISVTVSAGPEMQKMIDLKGMEYRDAFVALEDMGLKYYTPTYEYDSKIPADHVISFTPLTDTPVTPGTWVQMVVSLGPKSETVPVPSLVGMTQQNAENQIRFMNLSLGDVTKVYSDTVPAGSVVGQYPVANNEVETGTKVNLQISQGRDPSTVPKEVTLPIEVTLPENAGVVNVQVMMDGQVVFASDFDTAMEATARFNVTATGRKILTVYFNGNLSHTIEKEFS